MPRQEIAARAHAPRTLAYGDRITERIDLHLDICDRCLNCLELHRAIPDAQRSLDARCGKRAADGQLALGAAEGPLDLP